MNKRNLQYIITQVVDQIVTLSHPLKVILFGSAVNGKTTRDSDLDFMVVIPNRQKIDEITDVLNTGIRNRPMPCDFVVVTPYLLNKHRKTPGFIYSEILNNGREVYAC